MHVAHAHSPRESLAQLVRKIGLALLDISCTKPETLSRQTVVVDERVVGKFLKKEEREENEEHEIQ